METIIELVPTPILEKHSITCGMDISSKVFNNREISCGMLKKAT